MKVLITGTHFTPAVAVIEKLLKEEDIKIVYVGRKNTREWDSSPSVESSILPHMGVKFVPIISGRLVRSFSVLTIISLLKIPVGFIQAPLILLKEKPDVIVSFGGYTAVPVVIAGWLFSIPVLIHEQGLRLGVANKISSFFADKIALSFYDPENLGEKVLVIGNPLREEIAHSVLKDGSEVPKFIRKARKKKKNVILVTGGNQGSHIINLVTTEIVEQLVKNTAIIHITGNSKFHDYDSLKLKQNESYLVYKWVDKEFGYILENCDLVITRGGINTLMEVAFFKKPMIIVPIPNKEQTANAKYFKDLGMADVISQKKLTSGLLLEHIKEILKNYKIKVIAEDRMIKDINEDAALKLALEILLLGRPV